MLEYKKRINKRLKELKLVRVRTKKKIIKEAIQSLKSTNNLIKEVKKDASIGTLKRLKMIRKRKYSILKHARSLKI